MLLYTSGGWKSSRGLTKLKSRHSQGRVPSGGSRGETWVQSLGWEDPLEKGKATHSSILAWRIPWTIQSMGSQRVGHSWATFTTPSCLFWLPEATWFLDPLTNGPFFHLQSQQCGVFKSLALLPLPSLIRTSVMTLDPPGKSKLISPSLKILNHVCRAPFALSGNTFTHSGN